MRFNLTTKLVSAFGGIAMLVAASGVYVTIELQTVSQVYEQKALLLQENDTTISNVQALVFRQSAALRGYVLAGNESMLKEFQSADKELEETIAKLEPRLQVAANQQRIQELKGLNAKHREAVNRIAGLANGLRMDEAQLLASTDAFPVAAAMVELGEQMSEAIQQGAAEGKAEAQHVAALAEVTARAALAVGLLAAGACGLYFARKISSPIRRTAALAGELAIGNLQVAAVQVNTNDEVGDLARAFNQMVGSLRTLVADVTASTRTVSEASVSLTDTAHQVSRATEQAATAISSVASGTARQAESTGSVNETTAQLQSAIAQVAGGATQTAADVQQAVDILGQMVTGVQAMSNNANEVAAAAVQAAGTAEVGAGVVRQTTEGMARIKEAVDASSARIQELERLSQQIGEITAVISGIAGQTNLLALNAAIEAARAGAHGKGFAVVAEEVRKLAEQSSRSAKEIADIISNIQHGTKEAVAAMSQGTAEAETGYRLAVEAGQALEEIQAMANKTAVAVQSIAAAAAQMESSAKSVAVTFDSIAAVTEENTAATEEMAASAEQVAEAVTGIAEVAQENAAVSEEVSASAEELSASAGEVAALAESLQQVSDRLQDQVSRFKL